MKPAIVGQHTSPSYVDFRSVTTRAEHDPSLAVPPRAGSRLPPSMWSVAECSVGV